MEINLSSYYFKYEIRPNNPKLLYGISMGAVFLRTAFVDPQVQFICFGADASWTMYILFYSKESTLILVLSIHINQNNPFGEIFLLLYFL